MRETELSLLEVGPADTHWLPELDAVYSASFPLSERKPSAWLAALPAATSYSLYALLHRGRLGGFGVVYAPEEAPFALLEYLAVSPDRRSRGLGGWLLGALLKRNPSREFLVEVEAAGAESERRKAFYRRAGFRQIQDFDYRMPPVATSRPPAMHLMIRTARRTVPRATLRQWLTEMFTQVYQVENPSAALQHITHGNGEGLTIT